MMDEHVAHHLAHEHHELVQPQPVDAKPLPPHGEQAGSEVAMRHLQVQPGGWTEPHCVAGSNVAVQAEPLGFNVSPDKTAWLAARSQAAT